jgi:predicted RecB family nuclease
MKTAVTVPITNDLFHDFLQCKYKAYLKLTGISGRESEYENLCTALLRDYRPQAEEHLLNSLRAHSMERDPPSLSEAMQRGPEVIIGGSIATDGMVCRFDAIVRASLALARPEYLPVLYACANQTSLFDRSRLAFCGLALTSLQGSKAPIGKIVHGLPPTISNLQLPKLLPQAKRPLKCLIALRDGGAAPLFCLNDHCPTCEYREHCHTIATQKDDLSLLRGLNEKKIVDLHKRGIFTVTQYSYTFRLRKRQVTGPKHNQKHDQALQALAIRTCKIYVTETPHMASSATQLYLDVEGLPDRSFCVTVNKSPALRAVVG